MFKWLCGFTLTLFFSTLVWATFTAYSRTSGSLKINVDSMRTP